MTAGVQARYARSFFQNAAAILRLGGDQFGDLALPHQGWGIGTRRGISKQKLNIAGPDLTAIDLIGRACAAIDAAHHLERLVIIELGRGLMVGIIDRQGDFGMVA